MEQQQSEVDNTFVFEQLWKITNELKEKLSVRFELQKDLSTKELQSFCATNGEARGALSTFSGSGIDWLVHSWLRQPKLGFSTMRLTVWLGAGICVPHLVYEFATTPQLFFYIDYIPRSDLYTDLEYLDRYYEPTNQTYLELLADPRLAAYTSKALYVRQFQSPNRLCYTCAVADEMLELVSRVANETMERWLSWVDAAPLVAEAERAVLSQRDLIIRRTSAERDPGNKFAVQLFGAEMTEKLVRALWIGSSVKHEPQ